MSVEEQTYTTTDAHHAEQCGYEPCEYCGCCAHGKTLSIGCKVEDAPSGMSCPNSLCGCEGRS